MSETINDKIVQILNNRKTHEEVLSALRAFVEKLRKEGETKEAILARMQELRSSVSDEQEDILLEIMDFLVGWCNPHAKIE
jgi:hemerythrin